MLNETVTDLFASMLGNANEENSVPTAITLGDCTLQQQFVEVTTFGLEQIPQALREQFLWRSHLGCDAACAYTANAISLMVFAMRLDAEGNMTYASPSIKNARWGATSKFLPCGEWGKSAAFTPDLYLEAGLYGDEGVVLAVPTMVKRPYPASSGVRVAVQLSSSNSTDPNKEQLHNQARVVFQGLMQGLAQELGVPAGEQFLVCLVGYPSSSKALKGKPKEDGPRDPFWGVSFDGGYMVGGKKVSGGDQALPTQLAEMRVQANQMVGGRSIHDRLTEELMKLRAQPATVLVPTVPVQAPAAPPATPVERPLAAPAVEERTQMMPSGDILGRLGTMQGSKDEFELVSTEAETLAEPEVTLKKAPNPWA